MKLSQHAIIAICGSIVCGTFAVADETDPFAESQPAEKQPPTPKEFKTTAAISITPATGQNPEIIPSEDWGWRKLEKIEKPTNFNRHFDRPFRIWRVDGGYFGAFDGGEWGGALFFATDDATRWTRIINTHIQDIECFEGDRFLATGGLAHLSLSAGTTYLVTRTPSGQWQARMVFSSDIGIPRVVGTSMTDAFLRAESKKLVVVGLEYPLGREPFFGVDPTGAIHYLGERTKNKPSEQGGAGQPATAPESEAEGGENPKPESEPAPR